MTEKEEIRCRIAGFPVKVRCSTGLMVRQCAPYAAEREKGDVAEEMDLTYSEQDWRKYAERYSGRASFEYAYSAAFFADKIIAGGAFCFHASAISADGEGILFSADSGTGKSTQARIWREWLGSDRVVMVNDDKPVIRFKGDIPYVCGTPWSGKHGLNTNICVPVRALVFLEQAEENRIGCVPAEQALPLVFPQVLGGRTSQEQVNSLMDLLDCFLRKIDIYKLECTPTRDAAQLVYHTVFGREK